MGDIEKVMDLILKHMTDTSRDTDFRHTLSFIDEMDIARPIVVISRKRKYCCLSNSHKNDLKLIQSVSKKYETVNTVLVVTIFKDNSIKSELHPNVFHYTNFF